MRISIPQLARCATAALGFASVVSCDRPKPDRLDSAGPVVDSAGVTLVHVLRADTAPLFHVEGPTMSVGNGDGHEFVRIGGALRINDAILVADARTANVHYFDVNTLQARLVGRAGSGPAEFRNIRSLIRMHADSVAVYDGRQFRLSVFKDTAFVRSMNIQDSEEMPHVTADLVGFGPGRSPIFRGGGAIALGVDGPPRVYRDSWPVILYRRDGSSDRQILSVPGTEIEVQLVRVGPLRGKAYQAAPRVFGRNGGIAVAQGQLVVVDTDVLGYDVYDTKGRLSTRVRANIPKVDVTKDHIAKWSTEQLRGHKSAEVRRVLADAFVNDVYPKEFPTIEPSIVVDADGRIWLTEYRRPGVDDVTYWVFQIDGTIVGRAQLPVQFRLLDAGRDYVLGAWTDTEGTQSLRQYRLTR